MIPGIVEGSAYEARYPRQPRWNNASYEIRDSNRMGQA